MGALNVDALGQRIIRDEAEIKMLEHLKAQAERDAAMWGRQIEEIKRLLELARVAQRG